MSIDAQFTKEELARYFPEVIILKRKPRKITDGVISPDSWYRWYLPADKDGTYCYEEGKGEGHAGICIIAHKHTDHEKLIPGAIAYEYERIDINDLGE